MDLKSLTLHKCRNQYPSPHANLPSKQIVASNYTQQPQPKLPEMKLNLPFISRNRSDFKHQANSNSQI